MKTRAVFVVLFAFCLLLAACQPTPEETFIVGKDDFESAVVDRRAQSAGLDSTRDKSVKLVRWEETFTNSKGNITYTVRADMARADAYPVLEERPVGLDAGYLMQKIKAVAGENAALTSIDTRETKQEIAERIVAYKAEIAEYEKRLQTEPDAALREEVDQSAEIIRVMEQQYAEAPETRTEKPLGPRCRQMSSTTTARSMTFLRTWSSPS